MAFNDTQIADLRAKLDGSHVKQREQAGQTLSYVEGWHAIAEANRIFGFDAWDRETVHVECVWSGERQTRKGMKPAASYVARVRVRVRAGDTTVTREGTGAGSGFGNDVGEAHESAIKEAETDAMKRALMTFGNPFGLALYDKSRENVEAPAKAPPARQQTSPKAGVDQARQKAVDFKDSFIADVRKCGNLDDLRMLKTDSAKAKALQALADRHHDLWDDVQSAIAKHETTILERAAA